MPLDPNKLEKPLNKLGKLLKKLPKGPSPEQVHDIRTRARRVEAILHALQLDRKREGQRTLAAVAPVRKRAGKVRDMDVLVSFASTLSRDSDQECLVQLLEHLGHQRFRAARKLHKTTARHRRRALHWLKRSFSSINRNLNHGRTRSYWSADAAAHALQLSGELANWPSLTAANLHPFRLKIKELRNVLQLSGKDGNLVAKLGEAKDRIGEWHDWTELAVIAQDVLQHQSRCDVLEKIRSGARLRFDDALALASRLREQFRKQSQAKNKRETGEKHVTEPVLQATARLAA